MIGNSDVELAVFIEISQREVRWAIPGRKRRSCSPFESSSAVTEVNRYFIGVSGNDVRLSIPVQVAGGDGSTSRKGEDFRLT